MNLSTIGALEDFKKFDKLFDHPEEHEHRHDCPVSPFYGKPHRFSTFCVCIELDKADRDSELEDRGDDDRKYGGL